MIKICEQGMLRSRKKQNTRGVKITNGYFDSCAPRETKIKKNKDYL